MNKITSTSGDNFKYTFSNNSSIISTDPLVVLKSVYEKKLFDVNNTLETRLSELSNLKKDPEYDGYYCFLEGEKKILANGIMILKDFIENKDYIEF